MSKYGVISGPYFFVFGLNTGKYGPEITPYLDTLYVVWVMFPVLQYSFLSYEYRVFFYTAQKMKFSIKDFFSKCDQIRRKLRIWSHLLKKSLVEKLIFCAVQLMISWRVLKAHFAWKQLQADYSKYIWKEEKITRFHLSLDWLNISTNELLKMAILKVETIVSLWPYFDLYFPIFAVPEER